VRLRRLKKKNYRTKGGEKSDKSKYVNPNPEGEGRNIEMAGFSDDNININSINSAINPAYLTVKDILTYQIDKIDNGEIKITAILHTPYGWYPLNEYVSDNEVVSRETQFNDENTQDILHDYTMQFIKALEVLFSKVPDEKRNSCKITISGHADPSYLSMKLDYGEDSRIYNQDLSQKRADNTEKILSSQFNGVSSQQINNLGGFGWTKPIKNSDGTINQKDSRRIDIIIVY